VRSAALRAGLRRKEESFFWLTPALIPHPGTAGLGNVTGYFQPSRRGGTGAWCVEIYSVRRLKNDSVTLNS